MKKEWDAITVENLPSFPSDMCLKNEEGRSNSRVPEQSSEDSGPPSHHGALSDLLLKDSGDFHL